MDKFNKRLKHLREDVLKLSMSEMSKDLNVSQSVISHYESENKPVMPGLIFIYKLCNQYGISANWLIMEVGPIMLNDINKIHIDTATIQIQQEKKLKSKLNELQIQLDDIKLNYLRK